MTVPVEPSPQALWFPEWIPGIHGPGEQILNVGGLVLTTADGGRLQWQRDKQRMNRFQVTVPEGVSSLHIDLTYIANQPTRVSRGVETFGNSSLAILSPNTCLLYPDGTRNDQLDVALRVRVPEGWSIASGLGHHLHDGWHAFDLVSLQTVIDSPILAAEQTRTLSYSRPPLPDVCFHLASETEAALRLNTTTEETAAYLLPHEFVHAWCGKYRRPLGMVTHNYHTPKQTSQLWIYEGLTPYLGEVLAVRSGLWSQDEYVNS